MLKILSLFAQRSSNRNEFIEAITIKCCILLSVYKFITGTFTTKYTYIPVQMRHWRRFIYTKNHLLLYKQIYDVLTIRQ